MHFKRYGSVAGKIGLVSALTATALVATATPSFAASALLTLSNATGPQGGANTITATTSDGSRPFTSASVVNIEFQFGSACAQTYTTVTAGTGIGGTTAAPIVALGVGSAGGTVTVITSSKLAIKIPTVLPIAGKYQLCVYSGTTVATTSPVVAGSPLIANGTYSVAAASTATTVSPATGSAQGGTLVTIGGTALPTAAGSITATIGGVAVTTVTPVSATSFTLVAPPHAAGGPYVVTITTAGGTVSSTGMFTYSNGITVLPSTAPNTADITLDVLGVGFSGLTFDPTDIGAANSIPDATLANTASMAKVYLVQGAYLATATTPDASGKTNGEKTNCNNVVVISDTELLCQLRLQTGGGTTGSAAAIPDGTYTVTVVADGSVGATTAAINKSIISSGATFTVGAYNN